MAYSASLPDGEVPTERSGRHSHVGQPLVTKATTAYAAEMPILSGWIAPHGVMFGAGPPFDVSALDASFVGVLRC